MFLWHRDRLHRSGIPSYVQGEPQALCRRETVTTNYPDLRAQQGNCGDPDRPEKRIPRTSEITQDSKHGLRQSTHFPSRTSICYHCVLSQPSEHHPWSSKRGFQNGIMPLVTMYQCDAITGDARKSANTTRGMPIEERMDNTMKAIVRRHLDMKTVSGCDRTFPDCMMTFVFGWGKTDIENRFRRSEYESMTEEERRKMQDETTLIISDYQVTSAERFKRITNEVFRNGPCDADSHKPAHGLHSKTIREQRARHPDS